MKRLLVGSVLAVLASVAPMVQMSPTPRVAAAPACGTGTLSEAELDAAFADPGLGRTDAQEGFGGGDYQHAYPLPDGRVLWMFQDLHFSNSNTLGATNAVHNGALIQEGSCWTILGSQGRDFIGDALTQDSVRWFWPLDGEVGSDGLLRIFMAEMYNPNGNGAALGAAPVATWLATLDPSSLNVLSFEPAPGDAPTGLFGWSVVSTDQYTYLYSHCYRQFIDDRPGIGQFDAGCMRYTYLARVPVGRLDLEPEYWIGSGWSTSSAFAQSTLTRATANPMSVQWFGNVFVSVSKVDEWWGPAIYVDKAASAQGPWQTVQVLPVVNDRKCNQCGNYGAFLMPWLDSAGRMIVGLSNGGDYGAWRANAWLYRPTFYSLALPGPTGLSAASPPAFPIGTGIAGFVAVDPQRLIDTRQPGQVFGRLQADRAYELDLRPLAPAGATAVVLNLTSDRSDEQGWVRAYPCASAEPATSNVNPTIGYVATNAAIVPIGDGRVCFTTMAPVDLIVDLNGWLTTSSNVGLVPVTARRLVDTRTGLGGSYRLTPGQVLEATVVAAGSPTVAVALNVTAVSPTVGGFVTAWPCGTTRPVVSNLNPSAGVTRPNLVNVRVGAGGKVCLYTLEATDVIVDLVAEYSAGRGARYVALPPQRLLDTRIDGHRYHHSNLSEVVPLGSVVAAQVNLTATATSAIGYLTAYPCLSSPWPGTSNANFAAADTTASSALMMPGRGYGCVFSSVATDVIVDIVGVWT